MKTILVSGASGLIGNALCAAITARGDRVRTLSRNASADVRWDVDAGVLPESALAGVDAVVHLAGETVAQRWTTAAKQRILQSRVRSTELLVAAILASAHRPALILASGSSYYGHQLDGVVDESAPSGAGFLAEVCRQWEGAAQPLIDAGIRVAYLRTGIVLSAEGGALAKMLPAFKLGLGGRIGSGAQLMSWIGLPDIVQMYLRAIDDAQLAGAINAVAPAPISNASFTRALGAILKRPTVCPLPAALVSAIFGEMGRETVLSDLGLVPQRLQELGFNWQAPELEQALGAALNR